MTWRDWAGAVLRRMADRLAPVRAGVGSVPEPNTDPDPVVQGMAKAALSGPGPDTPQGIGQTQVPSQVEEAMARERMATGEPFGPGRPLNPFAPWGEAPRQWDYPAGLNIVSRPRSTAAKVSFDTLRAIIESYDVARLCIERRADEIRALDWHIVPAEGVEEDVSSQIKQARKFFERPDGFTPFDSWQQMFLEDILSFDAGAIYKHRTRGGKLGALEVVDGTTIAPLVDYWGRIPDPPAPAFAQFVRGMPWVWLTKNDLIYQPFRAQPRSPYGLPPVEWLLLNINTDLRWQWHFLMYFTEGTVPDTYMQAPPDMTDPKQIQAFQELWDAVMTGEQGQKHKVKWIPAGAKPIPAKQTSFSPDFPTFLLRKTCAAFKVTPAEIGFTDDVNRATANMQENVQWRASILPLVRYLEGIYTRILQEDLGLPLQFRFDVGGEKEDRLNEARAHDLYVKMGAESPDEVRERVLGLEVDPRRRVPRFILTSQGPIPVEAIGASPAPAGPSSGGTPSGAGEEEETEAETVEKVAGKAAVIPDHEEVMAELARWRANARKRVKQGKRPRLFESDVLPAAVRDQVWSQLQKATTVDEVNEAFAGPFFW